MFANNGERFPPCGVDGQGFKCVVVLPKGTNLDVVNTHATAEDKLLAASNKWLIAHEDAHKIGRASCRERV